MSVARWFPAERLRVILAAVAVSVLILAITTPENTGDARDYAHDVATAPSSGSTTLLEPGHLLWRPLGVILREAIGGFSPGRAASIRDAQNMLAVVSRVATVLLATCIGLMTLALVGSVPAGVAGATLAALGACVVNYGQAGVAYVASAALTSLAVLLGTTGPPAARLPRAAAAGILLALSVLLWLPFILVIPAALVAIYQLPPPGNVSRRRAALTATMACALVGIPVYLVAAAANNIESIPGFVHWIGQSSHGISRPGVARVVLGMSRSFVNMGNDGSEVRRYLVGDSLNPVTRAELATLSLWPKIALFYLALGCVAWFALQRDRGRELLLCFLVAMVPVMALGVAWSGGEEERYLPLYPFLFPLVVWAAWSAARERQRLVPTAVAVFGSLLMINLWALGPVVAHRRSVAQGSRLGCVAPMLSANAVIVVPHMGDPLVTFDRDRLTEPPRSAETRILFLLPSTLRPGEAWEETLAYWVQEATSAGGRVFVPAYVVDSVPPRWAAWVEGEEYGVRWSEVRKAFAALEMKRPCEGTELLQVAGP